MPLTQIQVSPEVVAQVSEKNDEQIPMLKSGIVQCLLQKFGQGAEHTRIGDADIFKVYLNPNDVEEGEKKVEVYTSFLHDEDLNDGQLHAVVSVNKELAESTLQHLVECASASQIAAARRRKSKKTKKTKKIRKQTRRR